MKDVTRVNDNKTPAFDQNGPRVEIQAQYLKNISFDSPSVPEVFSKLKEAPKIDLNLDLRVRETGDKIYEVTIVFNIKAKQEIETVFAADIEYSGLFKIDNTEKEDQKKQILLIYCPNLLFPFARSIIANITREAGFMPLMVNPVDFAALYVKQQENEKNNT
jgi:preprotein translocase subunit SecB